MVALLTGCGGGGSGAELQASTALAPTSAAAASAAPARSAASAPVVTVVLAPQAPADDSQTLAQHCSPANRLAHDPAYVQSAPAIAYTSFDDEKKWLLHTMQERYLWSGEIPSVDAAAPEFSALDDLPGSISRYLAALKTQRTTASGEPVDRFTFALPTATSSSYFESGTLTGLGLEWTVVSGRVPRQIRVSSVHARSAAAAMDVRRGDTVESVDGVSIDASSSADLDRLDAALFAPAANASYRMVMVRGDGTRRTLNLATETYFEDAVPIAKSIDSQGRRVGYLVFNDHIASAELALFNAVDRFRRDGVQDLVLDLRYNGGGYLDIAGQLASMIAPARQRGQVFERLVYNPQHRADDHSIEFGSRLCVPRGASGTCTRDDPLPSLELATVYAITTGLTCSASESLLNGLRGVGVNVVTIGGTTCGKPFGFTGRDNCGMSTFAVEFAGINAKGEGGYVDGLAADCIASDDLDHALGDVNEVMLDMALRRAVTGACPAGSAAAAVSADRTRAFSATGSTPPDKPFDRVPMRSVRLTWPRTNR